MGWRTAKRAAHCTAGVFVFAVSHGAEICANFFKNKTKHTSSSSYLSASLALYHPGVSLFSKHVRTVHIAFSSVFSMHGIPI